MRFRKLLGELPFNLPELSTKPYATHLPVLVGLSSLIQIRTVLELGCGIHSTLTFLNQKAFPHLLKLRSVENDRGWFTKIRELTLNDSRLDLMLVEKPMSLALADLSIEGYDLIFIDDSLSEEKRAATIREVVRRLSPSTVAVVHDFERKTYRKAAQRATNAFTFTAFNPFTGAFWHKAAIPTSRLADLNELLKAHANRLSPDDVHAWIAVLR